jgi:tetratricopeptide (TPR) repeat protein
MTAAAEEAEKGYKDFHNSSPEWAWKFAILRASVLRWRGMNDEVLKLMASEPDPPSSGDLAVQRQRLEGVAYASLHKFPEAERKLAEAERLCEVSDYPTCADVVRARAVLIMGRGHYAQAQGLFERVLASARSRGDEFQEANALLDLSWCADEQTHFDEALDWADGARRISTEHDFADIAQTALGNIGWAYYKLGDPEKAEGMFTEAKNQAEKLGDVASQVGWLTDAGYVYLDAGRFSVAEQSFQQSLKLAQQINSREDIINSLIALAFVSEQTSKLDDAKRYADEALAKAREDKNGRDQVYPRLVQGRLAARLHDPTTAESAFHEVAQSPDSPVFLKWEAQRSLARLYEDESQFDSAKSEYQTGSKPSKPRAPNFSISILGCHFSPTPRASTTTTSTSWWLEAKRPRPCRSPTSAVPEPCLKGSDCCPKEPPLPPSYSIPSKSPVGPVAQSFSTGWAKSSPTSGRSRHRNSVCFDSRQQQKSRPE